jgi:hypothetical protein
MAELMSQALGQPVVEKYIRQECERIFSRHPDECYSPDKPRRILQDIGSVFRDNLHKDIWVLIVLQKIENHRLTFHNPCVITDLRYANELTLVKRNNFTTVRIDITPKIQQERYLRLYGNLDEDKLNHPSETDLDEAIFDHRLKQEPPEAWLMWLKDLIIAKRSSV